MNRPIAPASPPTAPASRSLPASAAAILDRVDPDDLIGLMLARLVVDAADRLRRAADEEPFGSIPGLDWCRYYALADRLLRSSLKDLDRHLAIGSELRIGIVTSSHMHFVFVFTFPPRKVAGMTSVSPRPNSTGPPGPS